MRPQFPLFNTSIDLAHDLWKKVLGRGDAAVDATCGNGKDSLALAKLLSPLEGTLVCIDIQERAIENTKNLLGKEVPDFLPSVRFYRQSHEMLPHPGKPVGLIVFNLGYLPSGDKSLTTKVESTLKSVAHSLEILSPGGVVSIVCYPGHPEGKKEEEALGACLSQLDPLLWSVTECFRANRNAAPSLFLIQKKSSV